jgi:hypothetical protein
LVTVSSTVNHAFFSSRDTSTSTTPSIPDRDFLIAIGQREQVIPFISITTLCSIPSAYTMVSSNKTITAIILLLNISTSQNYIIRKSTIQLFEKKLQRLMI